MKTILPIGSDGAELKPRNYTPEADRTTNEFWETFCVGSALQNFSEAAVKMLEPLHEWFIEFAEILKPISVEVAKIVAELEDEKQKQRQRAKDDVRQKRREMFKKRRL